MTTPDPSIWEPLGEEIFGSGRDVAMVEVFRHREFADLLEIDSRDSRVEFVLVPESTYLQGASEREVEALKHLAPEHDSPLGRYESPQREVTVGPFLIGRTLLSQQIWEAIDSRDGLELFQQFNLQGPFIPVHGVNPAAADSFCAAVGARLPTEAEWEWAARGDTESVFFHGNDTGELRNFAWFGHVGEAGPMAVAQRQPNNFGLFDIVGNVWELCADDWTDSLADAPADGSAYREAGSMQRSIRGGSFRVDSPSYLAPAYRSYTGIYSTPLDVGFRLVFDL